MIVHGILSHVSSQSKCFKKGRVNNLTNGKRNQIHIFHCICLGSKPAKTDIPGEWELYGPTI